jgi:hypothetical protein
MQGAFFATHSTGITIEEENCFENCMNKIVWLRILSSKFNMIVFRLLQAFPHNITINIRDLPAKVVLLLNLLAHNSVWIGRVPDWCQDKSIVASFQIPRQLYLLLQTGLQILHDCVIFVCLARSNDGDGHSKQVLSRARCLV